MPMKHQHPDAHHGYVYQPGSQRAAALVDRDIDTWVEHLIGAKHSDPDPVIRDL